LLCLVDVSVVIDHLELNHTLSSVKGQRAHCYHWGYREKQKGG
jgi:hypothetical protein